MVYKKIKESPKCKYCDSINTQCNGKKYNKQRYICKEAQSRGDASSLVITNEWLL